MKVLFDGYWWAAGPIANRTVQRELVHAWLDQHPEDEVVVALRKNAGVDALTGVGVVRTHLWPHAISNRWELPRLAASVGAEVIVTHNYAPRHARSIVFIHDAMFEEHPEWFSRAERVYFTPMLPWARSAAVTATSTRTEASRIERLTHGRTVPIVTGLATPTALANSIPTRPRGQIFDDFALTVGRLNIRKNLESILVGAASSRRVTPGTPLYVVGGTAHSGVSSTLPPNAQHLIDTGAVIFLGGVDDAQLAWLYSNANLVISLSLDEGFGMPAVEAAGFGAPLLVSDIAVYRETVGDYAAFVGPLEQPAVIGAAIDDAWGVQPPAQARTEIRSRYTWTNAANTLRSAAL